MNLEKKLSIFLLVAYVFFVTLVLYTIYIDSLVFELGYKVLALMVLSFLYLTNSAKINIWYVLVLGCSIVSDALYVFKEDFRLEGTIFLLFNRVFYIMIISHVFFQFSIKRLLTYFIPFIFSFGVIFYGLSFSLGKMFYPILIFGLISSILGLLSFLNFLKKQSDKNLYFLIGIFIILISDVFMGLTTFLDERISFVIVYHIFYYIARYLLYRAMVIKKPSKLIV